MPPESPSRPSHHARSPSLRLLARVSQYELLHRMWSDRDSAKPQSIPPQLFGRDDGLLNTAYPSDSIVSNLSSTEFATLLCGPIVGIIVGIERRRWYLHLDLLRLYAPKMASSHVDSTARADNAKPDQGHHIELLQDDPSGFELFVKWLYQGRLDNESDLSDEKKYEHAVACFKLYLLCERFDMSELKNLSIDQYRLSLFEAGLVPDPAEIGEIYRATRKHSPFRKLMIQIAARQIMDPHDERKAGDYRSCFQDDPDFAVDMVNAIRKESGGILFNDPTRASDDCEYHDHSSGAGCRQRPRQRGKLTPSVRFNLDVAEQSDQTHSVNDRPVAASTEIDSLTQRLKALPTTSTEVRDNLQWLQAVEGELESMPQAPPPTPAKPGKAINVQQEKIKLLSAMGSMDSILEADRKMAEKRTKTVVPGGESPLNYVEALRLRQEQHGHSRQKSRDLFEV